MDDVTGAIMAPGLGEDELAGEDRETVSGSSISHNPEEAALSCAVTQA